MRKLQPYERAARVIRLLALLQLLAGLGIVAAVLIPMVDSDQGGVSVGFIGFLVIVCVGLPALVLCIARAVSRHEGWARIAGLVYGVLLLLGFPLGTIAGLYIIWGLGPNWAESDVTEPQAQTGPSA